MQNWVFNKRLLNSMFAPPRGRLVTFHRYPLPFARCHDHELTILIFIAVAFSYEWNLLTFIACWKSCIAALFVYHLDRFYRTVLLFNLLVLYLCCQRSFSLLIFINMYFFFKLTVSKSIYNFLRTCSVFLCAIYTPSAVEMPAFPWK